MAYRKQQEQEEIGQLHPGGVRAYRGLFERKMSLVNFRTGRIFFKRWGTRFRPSGSAASSEPISRSFTP